MKTKLFLKFSLAIVALITAVSCIHSIDPTIDRTEAMELSELSVYIDTLHHRGLDVDTTDLGVYYVVSRESDGVYPADGDTCILKYEGFLLSTGNVFDASANHNATDSTLTYIIGDNNVIAGWADGVKVANEGSLVFLIIPSKLAYGSTGNNYNIGPFETLIFMVDMVDIKQAY